MYGKIVGETIYLGLPNTGILNDGRTVSGYNLLDKEILLAEGWQVVQEDKPDYDSSTQQLEIDKKEFMDGEIVVTYVAVDKPIEEFEEV